MPFKFINRIFAGAVVVGLVIFAIYLLGMKADQSPPRSSKKIIPASPKPNLPLIQTLPSGRQRPLTLSMPMAGELTGARWKEDVILRTESDGFEIRADALYDEKDRLILVRQGREELETRFSSQEVLRILAEWISRNPRDQSGWNSTMIAPKITKVEMQPMSLGSDELTKLYKSEGFPIPLFSNPAELESTKWKGVLQTAYQLKVWPEGKSPMTVLINRSTDGTNWQSIDYNSYPESNTTFRSLNKNGTTVKYRFVALADDGTAMQGDPGWYLTEAWKGACPWPKDQLDPVFGDNLLSELVIPDKYNDPYSSAFYPSTTHKTFDAYALRREQVMAAKKKRLEQEASAPKK